jgi:hypothetical protein
MNSGGAPAGTGSGCAGAGGVTAGSAGARGTGAGCAGRGCATGGATGRDGTPATGRRIARDRAGKARSGCLFLGLADCCEWCRRVRLARLAGSRPRRASGTCAGRACGCSLLPAGEPRDSSAVRLGGAWSLPGISSTAASNSAKALARNCPQRFALSRTGARGRLRTRCPPTAAPTGTPVMDRAVAAKMPSGARRAVPDVSPPPGPFGGQKMFARSALTRLQRGGIRWPSLTLRRTWGRKWPPASRECQQPAARRRPCAAGLTPNPRRALALRPTRREPEVAAV